MQRLWHFLLDARTLMVIGVLALAAFLFVGADALQVGLIWTLGIVGVVATVALLVWGVRRFRAWRASRRLENAIDAEADRAIREAPDRESRDAMRGVRERMQAAVKTIKTSKLGLTSGSAALYELPWYAVIGNPAAGKSSAIVRSGLNFPFSDKNDAVLQGIGGTRNCDWFFTTEGILLDTAGRYSVQEEDRDEWLGFLALLKKNRPKAPLNGVIIAASIPELTGNRPEFAIALAKQLRQRVQELTERLEVFTPVYVVFTKADLISGFAEFFEDRDRDERERVWGATLPYDPATATARKDDAVALFDKHFDALNDGLKEASIARLSMGRGEQLPPGVMTFPLEFAALKAPLRTFLTTLFEDNPYQFQPIFRGFYFTSAVQEGQSTGRASQRVADRFGLTSSIGSQTTAAVLSHHGFFLRELFSKVIFADRKLVQQYTSRGKLRWRYAAFLGGALLLGTALAGWTWTTIGNRQLVANVQADLDQVIKLQENRIDLQSRLEAIEILQDRVEQLQRYREERPWNVSLGLYQGEKIERKLRAEYMAAIREVMLQPAAAAIAGYLGEVNGNAAQLQPMGRAADGSAAKVKSASSELPGVYSAASPTNVSDAYNALKTYLMLGDRVRIENAHLSDQLTRFWRGWLEANRGSMPREQLIRSAERILSFAMTQARTPDFPQIDTQLALVDNTRDTLRRVVKGMPARERVYAEIKARAATRYAPVTVAGLVGEADKDIVAGSYAVSGAFTRQAWDGFVDGAIKTASTQATQADDWVLKTALEDDLTLEGSPEQIRKALVHLYKTEYVGEWQKFMQGVSVREFTSFDDAVVRMNRLGDPAASPIGRLVQALYDQTAWDNPSLLNEQLAKSQEGFVAWFKQTVLRQAPSRIDVRLDVTTGQAAIPMGPIGKEFAGLARLMLPRENNPALIQRYLESLAKVRSRFNTMKNEGDPGPASRKLMQQTLEGGSELAETLKLVDEQMLNSQTDTSRATLRPLLVRPLVQAFGVVVGPAETEINRVWSAQVLDPFRQTLAGKYPFDRHSKLEATPVEIAKTFGPDGTVAKFSEQALGALIVRRGDLLAARTWADLGLRLRSDFTSGFPAWVSTVSTGGGANAGGGPSASATGAGAAPAGEGQTSFQVLPLPTSGLAEYTIEIDGQRLRYRNAVASWQGFVWPGGGTPGVRITGIGSDGQKHEFLNEPGRFGLERMLASAKRRKLDDGLFELSWGSGALAVSVQLRLVSSPSVAAPAGSGGGVDTPSASGGLKGVQLPALVVGIAPTLAASLPAPKAP